jgi:prephenate dehydrogenase
LGLIGSSIARAAHKYRLAGKIIGYDNNEISLAFARKEGVIDEAIAELAGAVLGSDLVIIATPPVTLADIAAQIAPNLANGAMVMDVASVKQPAIAAIEPFLPEHIIFIPSHPIAGSAGSGVRAGRADLFVKKRIVITPKTPPVDEVLQKITSFWQGMGANVEGMPADIHDMLYGYMSHLPQLLAFCVKKPLGKFFADEQVGQNPVYKSFLRISNSNPELWADIFSQNRGNILAALDRYIDVLSHVYRELKTAPENEQSGNDEHLAYTVLFPRIVASCLITTVMEAEKKAGFPFARYAGTGFADFSAPAIIAPEADIEQISAQYRLVADIVDGFLLELKQFRASLV